MKKLLFVVDPLDQFKVYKDTTFSIMREAQRRGHLIAACLPQDIQWKSGGFVMATVQQISLTGSQPGWYRVHNTMRMALKDFDAVLMRKDPPFNAEYIYATHLLEQAEREGGNVVNRPRALRDHPEKLAIMEFPLLVTPTLVTRNAASVRDFHAEHGDIILKPLDGMGGKGIFRVGKDALNLGVIIETLNKEGAETIMVQRFVPQIVDGDKRILIINGEPVPFVLARIPQGTEVRGNLAVGGKGVAQPLTPRNREIAETIGRVLAPRGLLLIGLDVMAFKKSPTRPALTSQRSSLTRWSGPHVQRTMNHCSAHSGPRRTSISTSTLGITCVRKVARSLPGHRAAAHAPQRSFTSFGRGRTSNHYD